jgi:copper chaperone CopZ
MALLRLLGKEVVEVLALKVGYHFVKSRDSEIPDNRGRVRVHIPGLKCASVCARCIEESLSRHPGIWKVRANPVTGRALIFYDPQVWDADRLKVLLREVGPTR